MDLFVEFLGPSTNQMYAGQHWSARTRHKNNALKAVFEALVEQGAHLVRFVEPVAIVVEPKLGKGKRAFDVSNYSYTYKLIEDALVKRKILADDSPEFVREVKYVSPVRSDKTGILISINPIRGNHGADY
jgi:hypothetical protein